MAFDPNYSIKQKKRVETDTGSWFCGVVRLPDEIENVKRFITEFPYYWYITHDKDETGLHVHFVINIYGSRTIKSICQTLDVDVQNVRITKTQRHDIRYLIHADDPQKYQYSISDIVSNDPDRLDLFFKNLVFSSKDIFGDLRSLKSGHISCLDFLDKYKGELSKLNFYQRIKIMELIDKMSMT